MHEYIDVLDFWCTGVLMYEQLMCHYVDAQLHWCTCTLMYQYVGVDYVDVPVFWCMTILWDSVVSDQLNSPSSQWRQDMCDRLPPESQTLHHVYFQFLYLMRSYQKKKTWLPHPKPPHTIYHHAHFVFSLCEGHALLCFIVVISPWGIDWTMSWGWRS